MLPAAVSRPLDLIRLAVLGPIFLVALLLVHTRLYQRWYPIVCPFGATLFGVGIVVQLALKAMHEWRTVQARGGREAELARQRARERRTPTETRGRPRVR